MTNKSATYMLPLVVSHYSLFDLYNIIDECYLYAHDDFEEHRIHVKIMKDQVGNFDIDKIYKSPYFIKLNSFKDHYLITLKLKENYHDDYDSFILGRYSYFNKLSKDIILKFWSNLSKKDKISLDFIILIRNIFDKNPILKKELEDRIGVELPEDAELSSIIDIGNEIYGG